MRRILKFCGAWTAALAAIMFLSVVVTETEGSNSNVLSMSFVSFTLLALGPMFVSGWYTYHRNRAEDMWKHELASTRQKQYADDLGIPYGSKTTKGELSALIEAAKNIEVASDRQKAYADSLGIDYPENVTKAEISRLIDRAKSSDGEAG